MDFSSGAYVISKRVVENDMVFASLGNIHDNPVILEIETEKKLEIKSTIP